MNMKKPGKIDPYIDSDMGESIIQFSTDVLKTLEERIKRLSNLGINVSDLEVELKKAKKVQGTATKALKEYVA